MYVVTTQNAGCIINTMTQITSENPIISISLNKNNYTNEQIKFLVFCYEFMLSERFPVPSY